MSNFYDEYGEYIDNIEALDDGIYVNWSSEHLFQSLAACIGPSLTQIRNYVLILVGMSAICQISCHLLRLKALSNRKSMELLQNAKCIVHTMCGLIAIYAILEFEIFILLFFAILSYILLIILEYFKCNNYGSTLGIILIAAHILYELLGTAPDMWQRLRGIQMVSMMKTISLAYDLEIAQTTTKSFDAKISKRKSVPGLMPYFGYIFCPATCVLGPWISYNDYMRFLRIQHFSISGIFKCFLNIGLAISFLLISNCVVPLLSDNPYIDNRIWLRTYFDALSVRSSHYFISFLSQATLLAAGHTQSDENPLLGPLLGRPWQIEWPRSLSALVRSWNIPMHHWLKLYVFKPLHTVSGNYILPIMGTYLVSALLHGLHVRIYLVLLSLAMFSFVEQVLRHKLANIFNACIGTNQCKKQHCKYNHCPYRYGWNNIKTWYILFVNFLFSIFTILHLAYLGIMMHSSNADGDLMSTDDMWQKWSKLGFLSHWIAVGTFIFYYLI